MSALLFGTVNAVVVDEQEVSEVQARVDKAGQNTVDYTVYLQAKKQHVESTIDLAIDPRGF